MALPATETFSGADNDPLSSNWTTVGGGFVIKSNGAVSNSGGGSVAGWNADAFSNDQYAQGIAAAVLTGFVYTGVAVRVASGAHTAYVYGVSSNQSVYLDKTVAGTYTDLALSSEYASANDVLRLEVSGTTITAKRNGATQFSGGKTDSSIASGRAGIHSYGSPSGAIPRLDDWEGGNLGAAAASMSIDARPRAFAGLIGR